MWSVLKSAWQNSLGTFPVETQRLLCGPTIKFRSTEINWKHAFQVANIWTHIMLRKITWRLKVSHVSDPKGSDFCGRLDLFEIPQCLCLVIGYQLSTVQLQWTNSTSRPSLSNFQWYFQSFLLYQSQFGPSLGAFHRPELQPCSNESSSACSIETQTGGKVTPEATKWEPSWTARWCPALEAVSTHLPLHVRRDVPDLQLTVPGERTREREGWGMDKGGGREEIDEGRWGRRGEKDS